jgi:Pectate lyase superfamily protein/F5/8 type C domain
MRRWPSKDGDVYTKPVCCQQSLTKFLLRFFRRLRTIVAIFKPSESSPNMPRSRQALSFSLRSLYSCPWRHMRYQVVALLCLALLWWAPLSARAQTPLAVQTTAQSSSQNTGLGSQNLISDSGLVPDPSVPGGFRFLAFAANYTSSYGNPNDETPLVHFDFGVVQSVGSFHVWNGNEPNYTWRGFRDVTLQISNDAQRWQTIHQQLRFEQAPGNDNYAGQRIALQRTVKARFVRFVCNSTWRNFGDADVAALGRVRFFAGNAGNVILDVRERGRYPVASGVVDVKAAPYFAKGDGSSDDTAALQSAINDTQGTGRAIYLPEGVYLVSAPLKFAENASYQRNGLYGRNVLRGAGVDNTTIRLQDNSLTDAAAPRAVIANGFISFFNGQVEVTTADWFHNSITDLSINIGSGNPGAKGLEFFSNNTGVVRNVKITSADGQGVIGLDLGHLDLNGPLLVKNLEVTGFQTGVRAGQTVNSQTFENITLNDQGSNAFDNNGQSVSIHKLRTRGAVPALLNRYGFATLVDAQLEGTGNASTQAAITNGEFLFARNVSSTGFAQVVKNNYGAGAQVATSFAGDYVSSGAVLSLFGNRNTSLRLPVLDTPDLPRDRAGLWANARDFRLTTETDDGPGLQRAIDSGARTVYWPANAQIVLKSLVLLRGNVERLIGMNAPTTAIPGARIRLVDGAPNTVVAEQILAISQGGDAPLFENASARSLAVVDSTTGLIGSGSGDVFLENVVGRYDLGAHRTFARQLNSEPDGTKINNVGGRLWVLGLKTERAGTLVATSLGGATEILGGLCYTTTVGSAPMFTVTDGTLSVSLAEVAYNGAPFGNLVTQVQGGLTRQLLRGQAPVRFAFLGGSALPLFVSGPELRTKR